MENLDEYILELQYYQEGSYDYGTLNTEEEITKAIENGKKIVFLKNKSEGKIGLTLGGALIFFGLIFGIILPDINPELWEGTNLSFFIMFFGMLGTPGLGYMVYGLFKMRTSFLVLGQEGIVYKLGAGSIKGFKWEDISLEVSSFMSIQIHILMLNEDFFKLTPGDYCSKEFPKLKSKKVFDLHKFTFMLYYRYRKFEPQEVSFEEDKQQAKKDINNVESTNMGNYNSLEDLRKEYYKKYKEKKYNFGKYGTAKQIQNEFQKGKIFILKGGLNSLDWFFTFILFIMAFIPAIFLWIYNIWYGITVFCLWIFSQSFFFAKLGHLLIISPSGMYYRKILDSDFFSWNQVTHVKEDSIEYFGLIGGMVTIYISLERTIKLRSNYYLNKEFSKKVDIEMFFTLIYIYSHQGEKPSYIHEMKEQLITSHPISGMSQLNTEDVRKTKINSDKKLGRSKNASDTQSPKFPPISELLKNLRFLKKE